MDRPWLSIEDLPLELLEHIISHVPPPEICESIRHISQRFSKVAHNVMYSQFRSLGPLITTQLDEAKSQLIEMSGEARLENPENEMVLVAQYTFLQIMYSEYRVLRTLIIDHESTANSNLIFHISKSLQEFHRLIDGSAMNQWDWRAGNVSTAMDRLRNLNSHIIDLFVWKIWNVHEDHFGPIVLKLMDCSLCSKYQITISHEWQIRSRDSKCHFSGHYIITDLGNTLVSPPAGLQESPSEDAIRILASYICDTVRWGNMFHTLRLRWVCMDRALALGRRQRPGWPLLDAVNPYISASSRISTETIKELRNGERKVCRLIERRTEDPELPAWGGMRLEFQLWCPFWQAPLELLGDRYEKYLRELSHTESSSASCTRPYHFDMEFKAYVRSVSPRSQGLIESTVYVRETGQTITITQSRRVLIPGCIRQWKKIKVRDLYLSIRLSRRCR